MANVSSLQIVLCGGRLCVFNSEISSWKLRIAQALTMQHGKTRLHFLENVRKFGGTQQCIENFLFCPYPSPLICVTVWIHGIGHYGRYSIHLYFRLRCCCSHSQFYLSFERSTFRAAKSVSILIDYLKIKKFWLILNVAKMYVPHEIAGGNEVVSVCVSKLTERNFIISQNV